MKITVEDRAPGAGAGRTRYIQDRTRRVLGRRSKRVRVVSIEIGPAEEAGQVLVEITAQLSRSDALRVSARRRLLPDALADAFDALNTKIDFHASGVGAASRAAVSW